MKSFTNIFGQLLLPLLVVAASATDVLCPPQCACLGIFADCGNKKLPEAPKIPNWVESLELSSNRLDDNTLDNLTNQSSLRDLKLNKNHLQRMPKISGLTHLSTLALGQNKITEIDAEALRLLARLQHLDLSRNIIEVLRKGTFPTDSKLRTINLNYNGIRTIEGGAFENLKHFTELKMNGNRVSVVETDTFSHLTNLRRLQLADNLIEVVSGLTFRNLIHLKHLNLRHNRIKTLLDGAFHGCVSLKTLELDGNQVTTVSKGWLFNLTNLHHLSLAHNHLQDIETDAWEFVGHLQVLDLSDNRLPGITRNSVSNLPDLRKFSARNNHLKVFEEEAFEAIPHLVHLDLSDNDLSWMIEDDNAPFALLLHLRTLHLSNNHIKTVSKTAFTGFPALHHLDLSHNELTNVHSGALKPLHDLKTLLVNTTSLLCNCHLRWLHTWLTDHPNTVTGMTVCNLPPSLHGRSLIDVNPTTLICSDNPQPVIITQPLGQVVSKGNNVTLECRAKSSSNADMEWKWKRDNIELSEVIFPRGTSVDFLQDDGENVTVSTSRLFLQNVSQDHIGRYQCIVSNSFGVGYSAKNRIAVGILPKFRKVPSNITVVVGTTARLDCAADGEPRPQMAWQKDGGNDFPAARERRMHVMPTDDAFFIINAKLSDRGVYTCTAENDIGAIRANATLIVHEAPSFVKPMENKEVSLGTTSVLECLTSGSPKPSLRWIKDGLPIDSTERHFFAAEDQLLIIVNTQLSDAGAYECEMRNDVGSAIGGAKLNVLPGSYVSSVKSSMPATSMKDIIGIVVITVVLCAVVTSVVWVVIIYKAKRSASPAPGVIIPPSLPPPPIPNGGIVCYRKDSSTAPSPRCLSAAICQSTPLPDLNTTDDEHIPPTRPSSCQNFDNNTELDSTQADAQEHQPTAEEPFLLINIRVNQLHKMLETPP
ncbi:hypothetical protein DMENIID0001_070550 [Sergentomyia squamirostris]